MNRDDAKRAGVIRHYRYWCPRTGAVKAYKRMTGDEARVLNKRLAAPQPEVELTLRAT